MKQPLTERAALIKQRYEELKTENPDWYELKLRATVIKELREENLID